MKPTKPDEMPDKILDSTCRPFAYHVVRYTPNLVRDEWINIGILLFDPASGRVVRRLMEEPGEFARVRRLHPAADEELLRRLPEEFESQLAAEAGDGAEISGSPGADAFECRAAWPAQGPAGRGHGRRTRPPVPRSMSSRRATGRSYRRSLHAQRHPQARQSGLPHRGHLAAPGPAVRVDEFTYAGDPMRIDYAYRRNGTRGFVQALAARSRSGPGQGAGVHGRRHPRQDAQDRICRRQRGRAAPARQRAAPVRHRLAGRARDSRACRWRAWRNGPTGCAPTLLGSNS